MRPSLLTPLLAVLLSLLSFSAYALAPTRGCIDSYGSGQCVPSGVASPPPSMSYASNFIVVDNGGGYFACQSHYNGESVNQQQSCLYCPGGVAPVGGDCPAQCQAPKVDDGQGGCKCPEGQIDDGTEGCMNKPDCQFKQAECSNSCGGSLSGVAYFYCEAATSSDPSTQLFHEGTYNCECIQKGACSDAQIIGKDGSMLCGNPKSPGCPDGSFYGEFNGQKGCIKTDPHDDPDETPNNCIQGSGGVYFGSTLYCVPPPDNSNGCPAGTVPYLAGTLKICKRTDSQGNSTGDSPDTNGYIKGSPVSGSGTGTGNGDGSGSGTGTGTGDGTGAYDAEIASKLGQIKANTDNVKASTAYTAANTQATANNTFDIKKNTDDINKSLTGTKPDAVKGDFTESIAQLSAESDQIKSDMATKFAEIKASIFQRFSNNNNLTGAGSLPCFESFTFLGQNIQFCFTQFNDQLQIIGQFIIGFGFLLAAFIVLRR